MSGIRNRIADALGAADVYAAHEHISSIQSFGDAENIWFPSDVIPDRLPGRTTLFTLLFTPYSAPVLFGEGACVPPPEAHENRDAFLRAMEEVRPALARAAGVGCFVALDRGMKELYGTGLYEALNDDTGDTLWVLSNAITSRYENYFDWYGTVMKHTHTSRILKPVHPDYLCALEEGKGGDELAYIDLIARVDALIGFYDDTEILSFEGVERGAGFSVTDVDSLDEMIDWFCSLCERRQVHSYKQLQAYSRTLSVAEMSREDAVRALNVILAARGENNADECRRECIAVQDYIQRRILEEADRRRLPYQIHTGMTTLHDAHPGLLEPLIRRYTNVRFALLHAYPFVSEAAYLARVYRNVSVDTSWLAIQSPAVLEKALTEYIGMVPASRVTASVDATSLEEYAGGMSLTRDVVTDVLCRKAERGFISVEDACDIGGRVLGRAAADIYGIAVSKRK